MELPNKVKIWTPSDMPETRSYQTDLVISNSRRTLLKGAALAIAGPALWAPGTAHAMPDHVIFIDNEGVGSTGGLRYTFTAQNYSNIFRAAIAWGIQFLKTKYYDRYAGYDWHVVGRDAVSRGSWPTFLQLALAGTGLQTTGTIVKYMAAQTAYAFAITAAQELLQLELRKRRCGAQSAKWIAWSLAYLALGIWQWFLLSPILRQVSELISRQKAPSPKSELRRRRLLWLGTQGTAYGNTHLGAFLNPKQLVYNPNAKYVTGAKVEETKLHINVDADPNMGNEVWKYAKPLSELHLEVELPDYVDKSKPGEITAHTNCYEGGFFSRDCQIDSLSQKIAVDPRKIPFPPRKK